MTLRILSLGAGVQSTTLALMAAHGEIEPFDCAIFADTQWEPQAVYDHLAWLRSPNVLPFPVHVVTAGNIKEDLLANAAGRTTGHRSATPPFFTPSPLGPKEAMLRRQCTDAYKLEPILRKLRRLIGLRPRQRAPKTPVINLSLGISRDEAHRAKPSLVPWIKREFPLLDRSLRRWDCIQWLRRHEYPEPPKSACIGCPYHSAVQWASLTTTEMASAIEVDEAIRHGLRGTHGPLYLLRSLRPLADAQFAAEPDLFGNECEGMCGL